MQWGAEHPAQPWWCEQQEELGRVQEEKDPPEADSEEEGRSGRPLMYSQGCMVVGHKT